MDENPPASCGGSFALTSPERPPGAVAPAVSADSDPLVVSGSAVLTPPLAPGDTLLLLVPGTLIPGRSSEFCWVLSAHLASAGLGPCQQLSWLLSRPSCGGLSRSLLLGMAVGLVWAGRAWPSCCSHAWGCRRSWRGRGHHGHSCLARCFCWLSPGLAPWGRPGPVATVHGGSAFLGFPAICSSSLSFLPTPFPPLPQVLCHPLTPRQFLPHLPGPPPSQAPSVPTCFPCFPDLRSLPSGSVVTVWRVACWLLW